MEWFDRPPTPPTPPSGAAAVPDETGNEHHAAILAAAKEFTAVCSGSGLIHLALYYRRRMHVFIYPHIKC